MKHLTWDLAPISKEKLGEISPRVMYERLWQVAG